MTDNWITASKILREVYEPVLREQIEKESALIKMMEANRTPEEKARIAAMPRYCYDSVNFGDEDIVCDLKADHDGDHVYDIDDDTMKMHVTWPNRRTVDVAP